MAVGKAKGSAVNAKPRAGEINHEEFVERGEFKLKGPQSLSESISGPIPKNARRFLVKFGIYLGDVRLKINPGDFIDVIPGQHWRHLGVPYQKYASLMITIRNKTVVPYNPKNPEHREIIESGANLPDSEREPTQDEVLELIEAAPTLGELEGGQSGEDSNEEQDGQENEEGDGEELEEVEEVKPRPRVAQPSPGVRRVAAKPKDTHFSQSEMADRVSVGMSARGVRKIQEYDPSKGNKPGVDPAYKVEDEDIREEARVDYEELPERAASESRPQLRGRDVSRLLLQNQRNQEAQRRAHKTLMEKQEDAEKKIFETEGANEHGEMRVVPASSEGVVATIVDPPDDPGLSTVPTKKATTTAGFSTVRKTEVIKDGVRQFSNGWKARPIKPTKK